MINFQNQKEMIPNFINLNFDGHRAYHIHILEPVDDKLVMEFILQFTRKQSEDNNQKQIANETTAIWVHLVPPKLHLVSQLCQNGFDINQGKGNIINVKKWIAKRKDLIPPFTEFFIGCGGVVIKDDCIFLVQEKAGEKKGRFNIPGGRADPGQLIHECAVREFYEETNMKTKYKYVINFRQITHNLYNSNDIYFPCYLQLEEGELQNLKLCPNQIQSYKWVPLSQYHQFTLENSGNTQIWLAQCITRLWKQGFDFKTGTLNTTKNDTIKVSSGQMAKISYHQFYLTYDK